MWSENYDDERLAQAGEDIMFEMRDDLIAAEKRIAELEAALNRHAERANKVDTAMMRKKARIAELERQLAAALATIDDKEGWEYE